LRFDHATTRAPTPSGASLSFEAGLPQIVTCTWQSTAPSPESGPYAAEISGRFDWRITPARDYNRLRARLRAGEK